MRSNPVTRWLQRLHITTLIPALLAGAAFSTSASAAPVWSVIPTGSWVTSLTGTLSNTSLNLTSTSAQIISASGSSNGYDIWDNAAAANSAQIWPATAAGQIQVVMGTNADPTHLTAKFGRPLVNPQMLVYSLDNSYIDYSSTLTTAGTAAILSIVKNPGATYDATLKRLGTLGSAGVPEGCSTAAGRGCAVVTFIGTYSQLDMVIQTTRGNNDGIGMQFGVDPDIEASMKPVPTLSQWGLLLMAVCLAGTAVVAIQRQRNT